jgi:hypothetical protein
MSRKRPFFNRAGLILLFVSLVVLGCGSWLGYRALVDCHVTVVGQWTTGWVQSYVETHEGRWPGRWEDLLDCPPYRNEPPSEGLLRTCQSRMVIDFDVDPQILARQSVPEFTAIRTRPEFDYGADHREYWRVRELINSLRKFHGGEPLGE